MSSAQSEGTAMSSAQSEGTAMSSAQSEDTAMSSAIREYQLVLADGEVFEGEGIGADPRRWHRIR